MCKANPLDKLELSATFLNSSTKKTTKEKLQSRSRTKFLQAETVDLLCSINSKLNKQYNRIKMCSSVILLKNGKLTTTYCKSKACSICNRIKSAKAINTYVPILEQEQDLYFVTLTRKSVKAENLDLQIKDFQTVFKKITNKYNNKAKRNNTNKFTAIKKVECNYNLKSNTYHFHYHILVQKKEQANYLKSEWLKYFPCTTNYKAQDVRKANIESLKELFKYVSKPICKDLALKNDTEKLQYIYGLDTIYNALHCKKTITGYGDWWNIKDVEVEDLTATLLIDDIDKQDYFVYCKDAKSWFSTSEGIEIYDYLDLYSFTATRPEPDAPPPDSKKIKVKHLTFNFLY